MLLLSLYFQQVIGLSPFDAGIRIIPFDLSILIVGPVSGKLSDRFGHLPFTTMGLILGSVSLYLLSTAGVNTPYLLLVGYMMLLGAGTSFFMSPNMSSIMGSVPSDRRGIASAFRATLLQVGFAISISLAVLIMTFSVPYQIVTSVISTSNVAIPEAEKVLFTGGLRTAYLWMAIINASAIVPSMIRGRRAET